jgi:hypothetical protein
MTNRTQDELLQIARNGGGLDFKVGARSTTDLVQLVSNISEKATVILRGLGGRTSAELVQISKNSKGAVILVLD